MKNFYSNSMRSSKKAFLKLTSERKHGLKIDLSCIRKYLILIVFFLLGEKGWGQTTYNLVTTTSGLTTGAKYLVVNTQTVGSGVALGYQNTNNRPQVSITVAAGPSIITTPASTVGDVSKAYELTLGGSSGAWTFTDAATGITLQATSSSSNILKSGPGTFTISFSSNAAVITCTNGGTNNIVRYNSAASLFSCYSSGQSAVYLYQAITPNIYWDANGTTSGVGGSATWNNATTFATTTGGTVAATATSSSNVNFETTAGTVTLAASQTVASNIFNTTGYTIATSGSGAWSLGGTVNLNANNITASPIAAASLTIPGVISGTTAAASTAFVQSGAGTTILAPGNTFTGKTLISAGLIQTTAETALGSNPGSFTADQITINGGGIAVSSGSSMNMSSNRGISLGASGGTFSSAGSDIITLTTVVTGTGNLTKTGSGILDFAGIHTYTGTTIINAGTARLTAADRIANGSNMVLGGGNFSTGATAGFNETIGTLSVTANSTIALGSGVSSLNFAATPSAFTGGTTLTVTGWSGAAGTSGTAGKIYVGTSATDMLAANLTQISFTGYAAGASQLSTGEIVPAIPSNNITTTASSYGSPYCNAASNAVTVSYTSTGSYTGTFTAQLSDASGSFSSPVSIGSGASPISAIIPINQTQGTGYRIRVVNSNPVITGSDNGSNITIYASPAITSQPADLIVSAPTAAVFTITATDATGYQWQVNTGSGFVNVSAGTGGTTNTYSTGATTTGMTGYIYQCIVYGSSPCGNITSASATLTVNVAAAIVPVVVNEIFQGGTNNTTSNTSLGYVELLVLQNNVDLRGYKVRDYNPSETDGSGGYGTYTFDNDTHWAAVPAGTLITILASGNTTAQSTDISDGIITIKAGNATYPITAGVSATSPPTSGDLALSPTRDEVVISNASNTKISGLGYYDNTDASHSVPGTALTNSQYYGGYNYGPTSYAVGSIKYQTLSFVNITASSDFNPHITTTNVNIQDGPGTPGAPNDASQTTYITSLRSNVSYRSKASGNYYDIFSTWEANDGTGWATSSGVPSSLYKDVTVLNTHIISYPSVTVDLATVHQLTIATGGTLQTATNSSLQIANGSGTDLTINGTYIDNGTAGNSISFASSATWALGTSGTIVKTNNSGVAIYQNNYEGGISTIPATANWIQRYTGASSSITIQTLGAYYPNLTFENTAGGVWTPSAISTNRFSGGTGYATIKGNLDIGGAGTGTISAIINENTNAQALLVMGNVIIRTGNTFTNTSGAAPYGTGLEVKGNLTTNGTLTLNGAGGDAGTGTLTLSGTGTQTISGTGTLNFEDVDINNTTATANAVVDQSFTIPGTLSFGTSNAAARLAVSSGNITLKSTATRTANVGVISSASTLSYPGIGRFFVERYFSYPRKWQFISVPTDSSQTIRNAWQEGATASIQNPVPGYGMQITNGPPYTGTGFDATSPSGPSVKLYNAATGGYTGISNTSDPIKTTAGYMAYIRGDRRSLSTFPTGVTYPTTLRTKGILYTGTQADINVATGKFVSIGNPYASAIDLTMLTNTGLVGSVANRGTFYIWDPSLTAGTAYGLGGFQTLTYNNGNYAITPGGGVIYNGQSTWNRIESGQAFYAVGAGGGTVTFGEGAKTSSSNLVSFTGGGDPVLSKTMRVNLYAMIAANPVLVDGTRIYFNDDFPDGPDNMDAIKFSNTAENTGIKSYGKILAVAYRSLPHEADTVFLNTANLRVQSYQFKLHTSELAADGLSGYIQDKFTGTITPLDLLGVTTLNFDVANAPGSYAADRFLIIFKQSVVATISLTAVSATRQPDKRVILLWKAQSENNIQHYEIERSANGYSFLSAGNYFPINNAGGNPDYQHNDPNTLDGAVYYRVKGITNTAQFVYSNILKVPALNRNTGITVYPNRVTNKIVQVKFENMPFGKYGLQLINSGGQIIHSETFAVMEASVIKQIKFTEVSAAGNYDLVVIAPDGKRIVNPLIIQ